MHSEQEKSAFSQRLQSAIKLAGLGQLSNAHLANRFNLRHPNQSISTQAFNHWLIGRSIPTPDKIDTLAKWLNISADWLRYGKMSDDVQTLNDQELLILHYFRQLSPNKQQVLIALLHEFQMDNSSTMK